MGKEVKVKLTCDACGKRIYGDFMVVEIDSHEFYVCLPRTAPINPCGNKTKRALLNIFSKSDVAKDMLRALDIAE